MSVKFFVNGAPAEFDGPEEVPLLWVVREHLRLTGSKFGCGIGVCGACTMHLDGAAVRTCVMPVVMAQGRQVTTIEGLSRDGDHPVQKAWTELDVPQCGYCQSGMIMAAADLLRRHPAPQRRRHRPGDDQSLSLRDLCADPRRHPPRRQAAMRHARLALCYAPCGLRSRYTPDANLKGQHA